MKTINPNIFAAKLAALFAQEIGLQPGNMWEPPVSRHIAADLEAMSPEDVESKYRFQLGLNKQKG